jgi:hypothetical protein
MGRPEIPFDHKYVPVTESGCWIWVAATTADGYGSMSRSPGGPRRLAHRQSYAWKFGAIPPGMVVCHRCDVRCCVNPDHLFLGSSAENTADKVAKRRQARGSRFAHSRLDESKVEAILKSSEPCFVLASRYGVTDSAISQVRLGNTWKHVPRPDGYKYEPYRAPGNHQRWQA